MTAHIPESWKQSNLLECAEFVRGVTYTKSDASEESSGGLVSILRANNIQAKQFDWKDLVYVPETLVSKVQRLCVGDVVIATSSGSLSVVGKAAQVRTEVSASFGAFCGVLRPKTEIEARYFGHFFSSFAYRSIVSDLARGVNINNLKRDHFAEIRIPVAPRNEQKRIADRLDTVLTRVDAVNTRLALVAPLLKRFRQSVLSAATSGQLTADFEPAFDPRLHSLSSLGAVSGGLTKNAKRAELPMRRPYLRVANVHANELRLNDVSEIGLTETEFAKTKLQAGDLLIVEGNGSIDQIGRVAIWSSELADCCHQNHLIRWRAGEAVLPKFALCFLLSPEGRRQIEAVASSTTGLHTLSVSKVGELRLPVPERGLQAEIVRRVETLFAFADRLEARLQAAQTATERLTPALLAKAFRGELVPQDPNDEPASELLKRLAANATHGPTKKRGRQARMT